MTLRKCCIISLAALKLQPRSCIAEDAAYLHRERLVTVIKTINNCYCGTKRLYNLLTPPAAFNLPLTALGAQHQLQDLPDSSME